MKNVINHQIHYYLTIYLILCYFFVAHSLNASASISPTSLPTCLHEQSSILLRFKEEFPLKEPEDYFDDEDYPKMETWKAEKNCCSWDGITCDATGHVIGLDLSNSFLEGPLHSNSSLFSLTHLQHLNLANNDFGFSAISSGFGKLSRLTHLNLSESMFSGKISPEISRLAYLVSLDLSYIEYADNPPLSFEKVVARRLVQNGTNLRVLSLDVVDLSSLEAESLGNLSSLETLSLKNCNLSGVFPTNIFHLPTIESIDVSFNDQLTGFLPEFHHGSGLKRLVLKSLNYLDLNSCNFSGVVPFSIGNLSRLTYLDLSSNNFSGQLPTSLGRLTKLDYLSLQKNKLSGQIPPSLGNLTRLTQLHLSNNIFSGEFPVSLANLTQLELLDLSYNQLTGPILSDISSISNSKSLSSLVISHNSFNGTIPPSLFRIPSLTLLNLDYNQFTGPLTLQNVSSSQLFGLYLRQNNLNGKIPRSISQLTSLTDLYINLNNLSGETDLGIFSNMSSLVNLDLSNNNLTITNTGTVSTLPASFSTLRFASCNISEFPRFLENQTELWELDLSRNNIQGKIPKWFFKTGTESLTTLRLSSNFITGWEEEPLVLPWKY